jgi:hypothetical protein
MRDLAKRNASAPIEAFPSGTYRMLPTVTSDLAKGNAWTVRMTVVSGL